MPFMRQEDAPQSRLQATQEADSKAQAHVLGAHPSGRPMKCELCGRDKPESQCVTQTLTDVELEVFRSIDPTTTLASVSYCKPCHRVMSDPRDGATVLSGLMETRLRLSGMAPARAEMLGNNMQKLLLEKASAKKDT